jgi:hypothetical protein
MSKSPKKTASSSASQKKAVGKSPAKAAPAKGKAPVKAAASASKGKAVPAKASAAKGKEKPSKSAPAATISKIGGGLKALLMGKGDTKSVAASAKTKGKEVPAKATPKKSEPIETKASKKAAPPQVSPEKSREVAKASEKSTSVEVKKGKAAMGSQTGSAKAAPAAEPATPPKKSPARASVSRAAGRSGLTARGSLAGSSEGVCREVACESAATTGGYCRMHYIKNWKKIKRKEIILSEGRLNQYIEELVAKYPDKYLEAIRQDLATDRDFAKVIFDLDLDEGTDDFEGEGESAESVVDVRGAGSRDFDDDSDAF